MAVELPDPTIDLDWSGYVGSITEIFARNAQAHPDRTCVVETPSSTTPERSYTYKQIFGASNVLAHYLHDVGVTNGDVVMIWAHRSVDLVVAIMGTLASGATFSVLDPAYPPARQKIYLEVSQPRALVQIARATEEAGPLAPIVREYIDNELQLKGEVPSLRIDDAGYLSGGEIEGKDVFAQARGKSSSLPDVIIGPDSNPTLSFTSGSEGKPKGVLGRHYSLAYYFSWMAERFNLSSESRYTCLSGIAHDPIQRDIFTPLFLGAQLLVPSKEDIQHEKLAEWMNKYKPTVTHLTPAMAQVLVGGATTKFDSLDRAFTVGDVLTTRDCRRLRDLAENVKIVNMYGTTETQRAVSYFEVPSKKDEPDYLDKLKDTVPAGRGMKNVQLLVVDIQNPNRICNVGETGEIYVRAAGLAEGYKGDDEKTKSLNAEKFKNNWFVDNETWVKADQAASKNEPWRKYWKGPRDRMYRTGDLGRYLESGDVECTGRADDQVKIRGFRIELNEIDSNLSQHPLIRDCKTVVQRDRNEEPTLVSYIVVELSQWPEWLKSHNVEDVDDAGIEMGPTTVYLKRFRPLQAEVRDHLKGRLQIQAVPTTYIVLNKLPLNPNGKVDKPNLPFPDIAEATEEATPEEEKRWNELTATERKVATVWAKLIPALNEKTIPPDGNFFDLGGHSLLAQQLILTIKRELGAHVPIGVLYEQNTLRTFSKAIERMLRPKHQANGSIVGFEEEEPEYAKSLDELRKTLPAKFQTADPSTIRARSRPTVFLTGATGFLGAYIIKDLLDRTQRSLKVIVHVRAKDPAAGLERLQKSLKAYGLWHASWEGRLSAVVGDLSKPSLGLSEAAWKTVANEADVVIHNGAMVHWVRRYQDMQAANVGSTIETLRLCNEGKPKLYAFVSSTSVLDNEHYVQVSEKGIGSGEGAVMESDDMMGSRTGLGTGYGQTKWVSEQLVREAGKRGLRGSVLRPGYVLGSEEGVTNTDDFLIRLLKGSVQLATRPKIVNTVNATPVTHVARCVVAGALNPLPHGVNVVHVTGHPRLRMNEFLSPLEYYGYKVPEVSYNDWKNRLEAFVSAGQEKDSEQHALMPLYHFCVNDLPANTRAPELDDSNAVAVLKADAEHWTGVDESAGYGISREDIGRYLSFLAEIGFVSWPTGRGRPLPDVKLTEEMRHTFGAGAVGGRGGAGPA